MIKQFSAQSFLIYKYNGTQISKENTIFSERSRKKLHLSYL